VLDKVSEAILITDVGNIDLDAILEAGNVKQVPAVLRDEAIHQRDARTQVDQTAGKIGADETKTSADQDFATGKCVFIHFSSNPY
jgi:hypothetical protein